MMDTFALVLNWLSLILLLGAIVFLVLAMRNLRKLRDLLGPRK